MAGGIQDLIKGLKSGDPGLQQAAAEAFAKDAQAAQAAAVPLVEVCAGDEAIREAAVAALEGMGAPAATDVGALAALLKRPELDVAYWAATLLGRLEAAAAPAVGALSETLGSRAALPVRERAAWALGKIGPAAAPAVAALQQAAASSDARLARLAQGAIKQIQS